ncbi:putative cuticle protein [Ixodes scapularis]
MGDGASGIPPAEYISRCFLPVVHRFHFDTRGKVFIMFSKVLVCCLFAYVACGVLVEHPPQPYSFGYDNVDGFGTRMTRQETGDEFNNKVGSYSYVDAFGVSRVVKYVADATGFHPTVETNEPGTKTSVPADAPFFSSAVEGPHPVVVKAVHPAPVAVRALHAAPVAVRAVHGAPVVHAAPFAYGHHAPLSYAVARHF